MKRGIYIIRGENVRIMGDVDTDAGTTSTKSGLESVSVEEIQKALQEAGDGKQGQGGADAEQPRSQARKLVVQNAFPPKRERDVEAEAAAQTVSFTCYVKGSSNSGAAVSPRTIVTSAQSLTELLSNVGDKMIADIVALADQATDDQIYFIDSRNAHKFPRNLNNILSEISSSTAHALSASSPSPLQIPLFEEHKAKAAHSTNSISLNGGSKDTAQWRRFVGTMLLVYMLVKLGLSSLEITRFFRTEWFENNGMPYLTEEQLKALADAGFQYTMSDLASAEDDSKQTQEQKEEKKAGANQEASASSAGGGAAAASASNSEAQAAQQSS